MIKKKWWELFIICSQSFNEGISLIENIPTVLEPTNIYFNYGEGNFKNRLNIRPGNVLKEKIFMILINLIVLLDWIINMKKTFL